ncbi:hypothetical protein GGQ54_000461 [Naumannella cuiyingiana]|uniref:Clp R domain-containing protein n=1 Tax=Naumannella cuiyingiana TaxID=1347891 RepID=A0A7Z0D6Z7_9ACTN|nr:Clp protease N-terminal domain-containing protein [Naumannella cuiyingiana]NYI69901.1 hypothetical protein [Naumannella cuiyingiana]
MTSVSDTQLILTGAIMEAVRARQQTIDVDHLLLGLVSAGGPSAALLARHGVGLAQLRAASRELERDELIDIGIAPPAPPERELSPTQQLELVRRGDWNFAPSTRTLAKALRIGGRDDRDFLGAALDDPRVREYLEWAGADPAAIRAELAATHDTGDHPSRNGEIAVEKLITATLGDIWPLLAEPAARLDWDGSLDDTVAAEDGTLRQTVRGGGRTATITHRLVTAVPPESGRARVSWLETRPDGRSRLDLALTEVPGGTRIRIARRLSPPRNWLQRLARRWAPHFLGNQLGMLAQALNQATASRHPRG